MTVSSAKSERQAAVTDIPAVLNLYFCAFYACVNLYQFIVLPLWLLPMDNRWGWTPVPVLLLTNSFWSLIHEAIHDLLHPDRKVNTAMGRLLSVMFGSTFRILRSSHLLHHKLNRAPMEGTEYYEKDQTSFAAACFGYYSQILGGLYLVEFLSPLLFFLPRSLLERFKRRFLHQSSVSAILMHSWMQKESWREIRIDAAASLLWFGLALALYGAYWPLFVISIAVRAFLISFLDNVYHYRTPVNAVFHASNLWLPEPLARGLLHFNLHGIHHQNPAIPWVHLPALFQAQTQMFHGNYFATAARQLGGPVALQDLPWAR